MIFLCTLNTACGRASDSWGRSGFVSLKTSQGAPFRSGTRLCIATKGSRISTVATEQWSKKTQRAHKARVHTPHLLGCDHSRDPSVYDCVVTDLRVTCHTSAHPQILVAPVLLENKRIPMIRSAD